MKLVTIVCEAILEKRVVQLLRESGAHGYTAFLVRGSGNQGDRNADMAETGNVQIQVIAKTSVSETLITRLQSELFKDYAMVAYETEVRVMRPEKF